MCEEESTGADRDQSAFFFGILFLEVGKGTDDAEGFGFLFQDGFGGTARDEKNVVGGESFVGGGVVDGSRVGEGLCGGCGGGEGAEGDFKGFGCCREDG